MQLRSTIEPYMRARIPLYLAGFCMSSVGLVALGVAIADMHFTLITSILLAAGFCTSWAIRARVLPRPTIEFLILIALLGTLAMVFLVPDIKFHLLPPEITRLTDLILAAMLAWLMVIHSFSLMSDRSVLFLCVPSLSLVGLVATLGPSLQIMTLFVVYLGLACFVLIQQNLFSSEEEETPSKHPITYPAGNVRIYISLASSVTIIALLVGTVFGKLSYSFLDRMFLSRLTGHAIQPFLENFVTEQEDFVPVATGPISLSEHPIMFVRCNEDLLWRGQTFDTYNGRGWMNVQIPSESGVMEAEKADSRTINASAHSMRETRFFRHVYQMFEILSGQYNTIFAAGEPYAISFDTRRTILKPGGALSTDYASSRGDIYIVDSLVSTATPAQLRNADDNYPAAIREAYLAMPQSCWRVRELARRITANRKNSYDKALAIQRYLELNCRYDTNAPASPEDEDAVAFFLLKSKRGYCDVFASAMVIMCRAVGIPARWVTGYATGEPIPDENKYVVRAKDRHAWSEVYFPNYGWITFDPAPTGWETGLAAQAHRLWAGISRLFSFDMVNLLIEGLILALLAYVVKAEMLGRSQTTKPSLHPLASHSSAEMSRHYRRMCDLLSHFGFPRHPAHTPEEYAAEVERLLPQNFPQMHESVNMLTSNFEKSRYGGHDIPQEKLAAAAGMLHTLARCLKIAKRRNLLPQHRPV